MPGEVLEVVEWIAYAASGWRYVFSKSFRERTHQRWKLESRLTIFFDVVVGLVGIGLTLIGVFFGLKAIVT